MKRILCLVLFLSVAVACTPVRVAAQPADRLSKLMDDKLLFAKNLLEAVALGDFDKVSRSASQLIQVSKTAEWVVHKTPRYELHSNEFRRAAETLLQKAREKNQDGVNFGYVELSMSCFRCHQYVREIRDVGLPAEHR